MVKKILKLISREYEGFDRSFSQQSSVFTDNNSDVEVKREFIDVHGLYNQLVASDGANSLDYDLFLCVTDWLPELIGNCGLVPLNQYLENDPPDGWPDAWSQSMKGMQTDNDGNIYGIAYHDGPQVFMYRSDLFDSKVEQDRFQKSYGYELRPPETWMQFLDVAQFFTRPDEGLWGTVYAAYPDAHNNVYDFLLHLWSRGGSLVTSDWRPAFHDEIGVEALQFYVDLLYKHKVVSSEVLSLDSVKSGEYYASGKAAMMWNWVGFDALAQSKENSSIVGNNVAGLIPRGGSQRGQHTALSVYWVLSIPTGSKQPELAYQFIKHCAGVSMDRLTSLAGGCGTRLSTWRDREVNKLYPCYSAIESVHENTLSPLPVKQGAQVMEVLNTVVDGAMNMRKSVRESLVEGAGQVEKIFRDSGYYEPGGMPKIKGY